MKKYHIVTGVERSGTSCMMGCLREAGIPIVGWKYPFEIKNSPWTNLSCGSPTPVAEHQRKGNPGFWEISEVVLRGLKDDKYDGAVIKVLGRAVPKSDPELINRAVFMLRNTESIAKSMTRIPNGDKYTKEQLRELIEKRKRNTIDWLRENRIPTIYITYELLLTEPVKQLRKVIKFLGRGDARWGAKYVKPQFDHSREEVLV